jgi:hypothetical protein
MSPDSPNHLNESPFHHVDVFFIAFLGFNNEIHREGFEGEGRETSTTAVAQATGKCFFLSFFTVLMFI